MKHRYLPFLLFGILGPIPCAATADSRKLPEVGENKVAYYAFDATPVGQGVLSLLDFTDNANIVIVFEGTLWELADTAHYNTGAMRNKVYTSKKQILNDVQTLRKRGILVLMNVDDAASWNTTTPFTTWDGKKLNCAQFAAFVDSCVTVAGFDGISLDVEHKAVDNADYRKLIRELGVYFGPLSPNASSKIYTGAFYTSKLTAPGTIFKEVALGQYFNFVMDMGYSHDNDERFKFWAETLGNSKVMNGMSRQYNSQSSASSWAAWHPTPDKAGVMVFAANVNKRYTDTIFTALGSATRKLPSASTNPSRRPAHVYFEKQSLVCEFFLQSLAMVSLKMYSLNGREAASLVNSHLSPGLHTYHWDAKNTAKGCYVAAIRIGSNTSARSIPVAP